MPNSMEIWKRFLRLPGARCGSVIGIASERAIATLIALVQQRRPKRILELGAGIGTLTTTILEAAREAGLSGQPGFRFYTIESHPFCLEQLNNNLKAFGGGYRLVQSINAVPRDCLFDLIVVDGGGDLPNDLGVIDFSSRLAQHGVILLEGGRGFQRKEILEWYGQRPHVVAKVSPARRAIDVGVGVAAAKQKPYRLFVFEPSLGERLGLTVRHFWCWLRDRVRK